MTQTNPTQATLELLNNILGEWRSHGIIHACTMLEAAFAEREARNLSDIQRLVWKDELAGICETLESCFDHDGPVRCGPCAIKASLAKGVEPDYTLPNLPEVSRLKRENARLVGALEPFAAMAAAYDPDEGDDPQWAYASRPTIGQVRNARATLAALKDRTHG